MKLFYSIPILCFLLSSSTLEAQDLPLEFNYSSDGHKLIVGNTVTTGFYDESEIDTIFLQFSQTNYWTLLEQNYEDKIEIPATLTHNGVVYDSVGVRFKGNTSYKRLRNSDKTSFAISMDSYIGGQDLEGYESLNLSNAFQDETAMREVLYLNGIRKHIAAAKGNYVQLFLNGQNWGVYPNIQALNKEHVGEWFLNNDATRWRCEETVGAAGNPRFNVGFSSLNYLGDAASDYTDHYTLKSADKADPWLDLAVACSLIDKTTSSSGVKALIEKFDLDQTLWFLASEIIFTDDDGYVFKGGMDYYAYFDLATNRLLPIEYDGNSCMAANKATTWSPFYKETDANFVLMNKLMKVPEIRQRYLAHFRTMLNTAFDTTNLLLKIDEYSALMSQRYANDPKAMSTAQQHNAEIANLKQFVRDRSNYLWSNAEVMQQSIEISNVSHFVNNVEWADPENSEQATVVATVSAPNQVSAMNLNYSTGLAGHFTTLTMYDDGMHGDGSASDGQYGAFIPAQIGGQFVRYFIESIANNASNSRSYLPAGAEHEVFIYRVKAGAKVESEVVINEIMASNKVSIPDQDNEYDDWIELYNNGSFPVDISGYFLSDKSDEILQWQFPQGTIIDADDYLIVWCDNDLDQKGLHANFKLSAFGETVYLNTDKGNVADFVNYGEYKSEYTYSRVPNGTGNFEWQHPTMEMSNETSLTVNDLLQSEGVFSVFPNPTNSVFSVVVSRSLENEILKVFNIEGKLMVEELVSGQKLEINVSDWETGIYIIRLSNGQAKRLVVNP